MAVMRAVRAIAGGLAVALAAGPVSARSPEGPVSEGALWSENLTEYADQRAAEGAHATAAGFYFRAYDRLTSGSAAHRFIGATHEPLEKGIVAAVEAQEIDPARTDLLCGADARLVRHARLLGGAERLTPAAIAVIRGARLRLHARLLAASAICPAPAQEAPPSIRVLATATYPEGQVQDAVIERGALARAAAIDAPRLPPDAPPPVAGRVWTKLGVALMASGLLVLGLGCGLAARERDASAALTVVTGVTAFSAGLPMLIIGDKRTRAAALAVGPRGISLSF